MNERELEIEHALIQASKDSWAKGYSKAPKQHAKLIKTQAKIGKVLRKYFKDLSIKAPDAVDWTAYDVAKVQVKAAFSVNVKIQLDNIFEQADIEFLRDMYDPLVQATILGAAAGETVYNYELGLNGQSQAIQDLVRGQIGTLIGKVVDKDGNITDNAKPGMSINDTTREKIERSIRDSLSAGENQEDARLRIQGIVNDPKRAELIANTESVNAYQAGQREYAKQTGAIGKEWQSVNDDDICSENENAGVIDIDDVFPSGDTEPAAHPNCLCNVRYVYAEGN